MASLENLETLIQNIAQCHALEIHSEPKKNREKYELDVKNLVNQLTELGLLEAPNDQQIETLQDTLTTLLAEAVLVTDRGIGKLVPLSYETLSLIFSQTNEKFRQKYFRRLLNLYYNEFCRITADYCLEKSVFEHQVKCMLPVVKFEAILQLAKKSDSTQLVSELLSNVTNYFSYPRLNQEDIYAIIKNKTGTDDFDLISYELVPLVERNGVMGDYFHLIINTSQEQVNLFAKFLGSPLDELHYEIMKLGPSKKEEFFYFVYVPKLEALGLGDLLDFAPQSYFSRVDDILILEDLRLSGYVGLTPNIRLEHDALKLGVKQIAKLHACSIILEEILSKGNDVRLGELYGEFLEEILYRPDKEFMKQPIENTVDSLIYLSRQFPGLAENYSDQQLTEKAQNAWRIALEQAKPSDKFRNVINHGDLHVPNMLFNFDENKHCRSVIMIDYQLLRYVPPTLDLLFFLRENALKKTLDEHKSDLLDEYYDDLSSHLRKFGVDIAKIYPRNVFDESVRCMKIAALIFAFFYSITRMIEPKVRERIFQDPEEVKKAETDTMYFVKKGMEGEAYRNVMRGVVEDFIELCDNQEI